MCLCLHGAEFLILPHTTTRTSNILPKLPKVTDNWAFWKEIFPLIVPKSKRPHTRAWCDPLWSTVLQYGTPPHVEKYKHQLEMVQRRAARFTLGRYHYDSHVSDMLAQLQWETLEHRRWKSRLTMFYKIQFGLVAIPLPEFIVRPERPRPGHPHQFQRIYCRTDAYKYSFFPFVIKQWNALPTSTACQSTLPLFQGDLSSLSP